jgi:hypothetical protein
MVRGFAADPRIVERRQRLADGCRTQAQRHRGGPLDSSVIFRGDRLSLVGLAVLASACRRSRSANTDGRRSFCER